MALLLCNELKKQGHRPILVFPPGGSYEREFLKSGIPCYPVLSKSIFNIKQYKVLNSIIQNEKVNILHTHELRADMVGFIAGKYNHRPVLSTIHNMITKSRLSPIKKRIYCFISKRIYNSNSRAIAISEAVRNNLIHELGVNPEQVTTIYNGTEKVELTSFANPAITRASLNISPDAPLLTFIGRFIPIQKGQEYLINAMPEILQKHPSAHLLMVGDGAIRKELESLCDALMVKKNITFCGWRNDINDILYASDICVVPSLWEPFGKIVIEAMMAGKPVVGSNVDGIKEIIIHEETGLLVEPKNSMELAKAIGRLLDNPGLAKTMGEKGRLRALEKFTSARYAEKTLDLYQTCIKEYSGV